MRPPARVRKPSLKKMESDLAAADLDASCHPAQHSSQEEVPPTNAKEKQPCKGKRSSVAARKELTLVVDQDPTRNKRSRKESSSKIQVVSLQDEPKMETPTPAEPCKDPANISRDAGFPTYQLPIAPEVINHQRERDSVSTIAATSDKPGVTTIGTVTTFDKPGATTIGSQLAFGIDKPGPSSIQPSSVFVKPPMPKAKIDKGKGPAISSSPTLQLPKLQLPNLELLKRELEKRLIPKHFIRGPAAGLFSGESGSSVSLKPLGERCQLCSIDLAFMPKGQPSDFNNNFPDCTILPCGHLFHSRCYDEVHPPFACSKSPQCSSCAV